MKWLGWLLFALSLLGCGVWALSGNPEGQGLLLQALRAMFGFFTSPFILEASLACVGLLVVLTINEYRGKKEQADEWVEMLVEEPEQTPKQKE
jgi:hypothetical protein